MWQGDKSAPGNQVHRVPHFCVEPFPSSQWKGQTCAGKQVLMLSQLCLQPQVPLVQHQGCRGRYSLSWESKLIISPRLGLRSWVMSKGPNPCCTSPSTSAQPLHHPSIYFAMPHTLMAKGTNALSHLRNEIREVLRTVGKSWHKEREGSMMGFIAATNLEFWCWYQHHLKVE